MSSHHFVKEDQEPVLLILDGQAIPFERTQELLEWSPTVIVLESALDHVLGWGIKIDRVLCNGSSVRSLEARLADQMPIRFITFCKAPECLPTAMHFLLAKMYKAVNVLIRGKSDFDFLQTFPEINVEVFYQNTKWSFMSLGHFKKRMPDGIPMLIYQSGTIRSAGRADDWMSNRSGFVEIKSDLPFWIGEALS
jgi:thiamine pyrophosphokinase